MADVSENIDKKKDFINVGNVLKAKNSKLAKWIPSFIIKKLERIIHQDEINKFISENNHLYGLDFVDAIVKNFNINVTYEGLENIKLSDRYIVACNHPLGGLDGIALMWVVSKINPNIVFPVNDILMYLENLKELFIPINKHGSNKDNIKIMDETFMSDKGIMYFPAGICSRKQKGEICDLDWKKTFITKAIQYKRDIIPCHINGRNSNWFYNLSNFRKKIGLKKTNLEMLYLPDEMFKQKNKNIHFIFGKPIPYTTFDNTKNANKWAQLVKNHVYDLSKNPTQNFLN